jgi:hypothetical protein
MGILRRTPTSSLYSPLQQNLGPRRWSSLPVNSHRQTSSRLPHELIERILSFALIDHASDNITAAFRIIAGFTRASRRFRVIGLWQFFTMIKLQFDSQKQINQVFYLLERPQYGFSLYARVR